MKHIKRFNESEERSGEEILDYIKNCFIDFKDNNELKIEPELYDKNRIYLRVDIKTNPSYVNSYGNDGYDYVDYEYYKIFNRNKDILYDNLYDAIDKVEAEFKFTTRIVSFREENGVTPIYVYFKI